MEDRDLPVEKMKKLLKEKPRCEKLFFVPFAHHISTYIVPRYHHRQKKSVILDWFCITFGVDFLALFFTPPPDEFISFGLFISF